MNHIVHVISCALFLSTPMCFAAPSSLQNNNAQINVALNRFLALSCDVTGNLCTAIGRDTQADNANLLVYRSQDAGLNWSNPVSLSKVPNSRDANAQDLATDIQCDATAQRCFIITSTKIDKDVVLIVYHNTDGQQNWSQPSVLPLPKSKLQQEGRYVYAKLSCSYSGFSCVIAGTSRVGNKTIPLLYTSKDAGRKWISVSSLAKPWYTYDNGISLFNVHCDNSGFLCKAVGYALTRNSFWSSYYTSKPVVYTSEDGGSHWSDPLVLPCEINDDKKASVLTLIKCDGTGSQCTAIGFTIDVEAEKSRFYSFSTANGGVNWESKRWINPDYANEFLASFDCDDSMLNCIAVGHENKMIAGGSYLRGLIYASTSSAQTWEKDTSQQFSGFSYLTDIFCSRYNELCIAVGVQEVSNLRAKTQLTPASNSYDLLRKLPVVVRPE